jgi:hypothetical protein
VVALDTLTVEAVLKIGDGPDPMVIWHPPED